MKYFLLGLFSLASFLQALEVQPWFGEVYEFHFLTGYAYSRYRKVDSAIDQLTSASNDHLLFGQLEFSPNPYWSVDGDIEFADTPSQSFSFRSTALQGRYLWLDDIVGDPITLVTGFNGRFTSSRSVKDVSSPYGGNVDVEGNIAIGKEFDQGGYWRFRVWGYGVVGVANKGSPWVRGQLSFEGNFSDQHKWGFYLIGAHGYGSKTRVNIASFDGYGKIRYKYVDLRARYGRKFGIWGTLRLEYQRRLFASRCPEKVDTLAISYLLPFSF